MGERSECNNFSRGWLNICKTQLSTSSSGNWREFTWKNMIRFFIRGTENKTKTEGFAKFGKMLERLW